MRNRWLFLLALAGSLIVTLAWLYLNRPSQNPPHKPILTELTTGTFVTPQLFLESFLFLRQQGIKSVIDMRPDGEAKDQPTSSDIESAALEHGIKFSYIPVPHESIPGEAVERLATTLAQKEQPAVLYCRTGRRAVRLFALAEASRFDGPSLDQLQQMVIKAGFEADDLKVEIEHRIAKRQKTEIAP